jgi:hypothetical protein
MNEFHSEKSKVVQNEQITHLLTVKAIDCVKESLKWMNRRAKANTRAEANMRAKANARAGTRNVAVGARENLTPLAAGSGSTPHCEASTQECEERHVLTFVSTLRRYIDTLITDSFIRTS